MIGHHSLKITLPQLGTVSNLWSAFPSSLTSEHRAFCEYFVYSSEITLGLLWAEVQLQLVDSFPSNFTSELSLSY